MRYINDLREMIISSAELYGDDTAFMVKDSHAEPYRRISFRQFREDIDSFGTALIEKGLKGGKIALIGENSYEWVVSYFAAVNGTGVIVPLDRELPAGETAMLLKRIRADAVIFSEKQKAKVLEAAGGSMYAGVMIVMNSGGCERDEDLYEWTDLKSFGRELVRGGDKRFTDADIDCDAMCALIFTSGTTGSSKGVMLSHKNLASNVYNLSRYVKIRRPGTGISILPMHHTYEMTCNIFTAIYQGMAMAVCEGLRHVQRNIRESQATVMVGVPLIFESMHRKIRKRAEVMGTDGRLGRMMKLTERLGLHNHQRLMRRIFAEVRSGIGESIGIFVAGGAAMNPRVIKDYESVGIPVLQGYGMTECAPIIAVHKDCWAEAESVGLAIPGTEVRISEPDSDGIGEIICKGPSVMLGYYDNPQATSEVLKDGWLYTGDYGKFDEEGFLYICGRKKNIIVSRNGKNIYPEEIETLLMEQPLIAEALVYGSAGREGGDVVVKAEIFPDYDAVKARTDDVSCRNLEEIIKDVIDKVNDTMPVYKQIRRFSLRECAFEKTTAHKIKKTGEAVRTEGN